MRKVTWVDDKGRNHCAIVRDSDPDEVAFTGQGLSRDPPDVERLDWEAVKTVLHNELARRGLVTQENVVKAQNGVTAAVLAALQPAVVRLYREGGK